MREKRKNLNQNNLNFSFQPLISSNGITLIALVITIIVMLILVAVTISVAINGGLFEYAGKAVGETQNAIDAEQQLGNGKIQVGNLLYNSIGDYLNGIPLEELPKLPDLDKTETEVDRSNGVIDIIWLDINNKAIENPMSPKDYLGGLEAVKFEDDDWTTNVDTDNKNNDWYNYKAQTGNTTTGGDSQWANARTSDGNAYFVWIPRYAYKITYFDTPTHAEAYRNIGTKEGVIGYSTIQGIISVDKDTGEQKLVEGTEPINVTGTVKTAEYVDYIPHPAFTFGNPETADDAEKTGIWIGKFEASGSTKGNGASRSITSIKILPDVSSLRGQNVSVIFAGCRNMNTWYVDLTCDTHMMKNTEWGAVAYLTESKYGRNGTKVSQNTNSSYYTGGGTTGAYKTTENVLQSSTGNVYGIYDLNGGAYEYIAAYINNTNVSSNGFSTAMLEAVATEGGSKYADIYTVTTDNQEENYGNAKGMKGDAVYETSTAGAGTKSWYGAYSIFPYKDYTGFKRGGYYNDNSERTGVFNFEYIVNGHNQDRCGFRVVIV